MLGEHALALTKYVVLAVLNFESFGSLDLHRYVRQIIDVSKIYEKLIHRI
jgi:hypothetical protein